MVAERIKQGKILFCDCTYVASCVNFKTESGNYLYFQRVASQGQKSE